MAKKKEKEEEKKRKERPAASEEQAIGRASEEQPIERAAKAQATEKVVIVERQRNVFDFVIRCLVTSSMRQIDPLQTPPHLYLDEISKSLAFIETLPTDTKRDIIISIANTIRTSKFTTQWFVEIYNNVLQGYANQQQHYANEQQQRDYEENVRRIRTMMFETLAFPQESIIQLFHVTNNNLEPFAPSELDRYILQYWGLDPEVERMVPEKEISDNYKKLAFAMEFTSTTVYFHRKNIEDQEWFHIITLNMHIFMQCDEFLQNVLMNVVGLMFNMFLAPETTLQMLNLLRSDRTEQENQANIIKKLQENLDSAKSRLNELATISQMKAELLTSLENEKSLLNSQLANIEFEQNYSEALLTKTIRDNLSTQDNLKVTTALLQQTQKQYQQILNLLGYDKESQEMIAKFEMSTLKFSAGDLLLS